MSKPQLLSAANFGALLVHQYEEYEDFGWFPGQFNHGVLKSDQPRNYPLNQTTALCVNTVFAYPFYIAPAARECSGAGARRVSLDRTPHPSDGGRSHLGVAYALGHGLIGAAVAACRRSRSSARTSS
jgi:hypothetical protein